MSLNFPQFEKIIDISQPVEENTACFPGDTPFSRRITCSYAESNVINLTALTMSPHVGTHADAPVHIKGSLEESPKRDQERSELRAGELDLKRFIGPVLVLDFAPTEAAITAAMIENKLTTLAAVEADAKIGKILFRTQSTCNYKTFADEYSYLAVDGAEYLATRGVDLIGLDTPSVDHIRSKDLPCHQVLDNADMVWLENLDLSQVKQGSYYLLALPIKFMQLEASPVRAVLLA